MHLDFVSVLPEMFDQVLRAGVLGRAALDGVFSWRAVPVRAFASGRHRVTDEPPLGGGAGMVMKVEPLVKAIRWATGQPPGTPAPPLDAEAHPAPAQRVHAPGLKVVLLDAAGQRFNQQVAQAYAGLEHLVLVCGRYEGVDERVRAHLDEELSLGDYVLTGGELGALVVADAVVRLLPGTLGNPDSITEESHTGGLLEYPHYTRPRVFEGVEAPEVLLSGHHARIEQWRRQQSLLRTRARRPDLLAAHPMSAQDQRLLDDADGKPAPQRRKRKRTSPPPA